MIQRQEIKVFDSKIPDAISASILLLDPSILEKSKRILTELNFKGEIICSDDPQFLLDASRFADLVLVWKEKDSLIDFSNKNNLYLYNRFLPSRLVIGMLDSNEEILLNEWAKTNSLMIHNDLKEMLSIVVKRILKNPIERKSIFFFPNFFFFSNFFFII